MSPAALSILTTTFREGAERNRALSIWGAVAAGGFAAGVLLGSILTDWLNWRWVMFVNVPIGLALNTSQQIGSAVGLAILVAVATARTEAISASTANSPVAITGGFQAALGVGTGFAALGILVAVLMIRKSAENSLDHQTTDNQTP